MHEIVINLHMHTTYSDGTGSHQDILHAAHQAGLDAVIVTDHNILVKGVETFLQEGDLKTLLLTGEEIHNPYLKPSKNHLLVFGTGKELAGYSSSPQKIIDQANLENGLTFLAHPHEDALPLVKEDDITWEDWQVSGYTGIELWNGLSELKTVLKGKTLLHALFYAFFPQAMAHAPKTDTLNLWDELTGKGLKIVAVAGSDAHALHISRGIFHATLYPYEFHFRCINTHLIVPGPLSGNLDVDQEMIYSALHQGHAFIGYDLPGSTRGFQFTAQGENSTAWMGETIALKAGVTLHIKLPHTANHQRRLECNLICKGQVIKSWREGDVLSYHVQQPGVYRVECTIQYLGKRRGWIYSNPIYIQ
jgi:hypothetical protein